MSTQDILKAYFAGQLKEERPSIQAAALKEFRSSVPTSAGAHYRNYLKSIVGTHLVYHSTFPRTGSNTTTWARRARSDATSQARIAKLEEHVKSLEERIKVLEHDRGAVEIRNVEDGEAEEEISAFFRANDGSDIYPSDIASALRLDYEQVQRLVQKLERDGKISAA